MNNTVNLDSKPKATSDKNPQRVALVTGGAMGIGSAISGRLANQGYQVLVTDINLEIAEKTAKSIRASGLSANAIELDVSNSVLIDHVMDRVCEKFGRCDILVNNAGIAKTFPFLDFPAENWRMTMDVNLTGPLQLAQRAAKLMVEQGWGRIINLASVSGIRAGIGRTAYGTSKAAIIGLTRQMAIELAQFGITANSVAPGPIETPMVSKLHTPAMRENFLRNVPMRRYGRPEEVAAVVAFFASDDSEYVTGQTLTVDGGFVAAGVLDA